MPSAKFLPQSFLLIALAMAGPSSLAAAETEAQHRLQYKFQMGEVLRYGIQHTTNIRTTIEGTTQEAHSLSKSIKAWKVTDVLPSGEMEFVHLVERVRMSNRVPNRAPRKYDSETDQTPPPGFEQAASAVGVPLSVIRIAPTGQVVHRVEKHPQPTPSPDLPITLPLPPDPIAVGATWDFVYEVNTQRAGGAPLSVSTRRVCTLEQVQAGVATIAVEYQLLTPVSPYVESQLVDRLSQGKLRFDIEQGRFLSQQLDVDRRIIGFSGDASSMHFVSRLEERLLEAGGIGWR